MKLSLQNIKQTNVFFNYMSTILRLALMIILIRVISRLFWRLIQWS